MKWLQEYQCWVFDDGRVATPGKHGLKYKKQWKDHEGYFRVSFWNSIVTNAPVHRLLALAFIPNPRDLPVVDHIDRNRDNNALTNLRWATHSENNFNKNISDECIRKYGVHSKDPLYTKVRYKTHKIEMNDKVSQWREKNRDRYNEYMREYRRKKLEDANG